MFYFVKLFVSSGLIVVASELSKLPGILGAMVVSLPLTTLMTMFWVHIETGDLTKISKLSIDIFWMIIPSLAFLRILPLLLEKGWGFYPAIGISLSVLIILYLLMGWVLNL